MFTNTKSVLYVVIMLGTTSVALAAPRYPTDRQAGAITRTQVPTSTYGSDSLPQAPGQITRMSAEHFNPNSRNIQRIHILCIGTARSVDLESGVAGRVQIPRFQCDAKCIGTNYFFNRRCPDAGLRPQNSKKVLGPRAPPKHKSLLRQKRSLMSTRTGFIMQI